MRPIYLYAHLPKTGGQSVRFHFATQLGSRIASVNGGNQISNYLEKATQAEVDDLDLVIGHRVSFVTTLREPAALLASHYNFLAARHLVPPKYKTFESWALANRNKQAKWLVSVFAGRQDILGMHDKALLREARKILNGFWLVARLDKLTRALHPLCKVLGVRAHIDTRHNVAGRDHGITLRRTPEMDAELRNLSNIDVALYNEFCARASYGCVDLDSRSQGPLN